MSNPATPAVKWDSDRREIPCFLKDGETQRGIDIVLHTTDERQGYAMVHRIDYKGQDPAIFDSVSSDIVHYMHSNFESFDINESVIK